jgi:RNA polymerase sigma factor (sigma-70 family)
MPMMVNNEHVQMRRELVRELMQCGATRPQIADAMEISIAAVGNDIKVLGGASSIVKRVFANERERYSAQLTKFAELYTQNATLGIYQYLYSILRINELKSSLRAQERSAIMLHNPFRGHWDNFYYHRILLCVFPIKLGFPFWPVFAQSFFYDIVRKNVAPCDSFEELLQAMTQGYHEQIVHTYTRVLSHDHKEEIARWLDQTMSEVLSPRTVEIVRLSFGYEFPPISNKEIAQKFGLSRSRVWQIIDQAFSHLRERARTYESLMRFCRAYGDPEYIASLEAQVASLKEELRIERFYREFGIPKEERLINALKTPINELEVSVRTYNCLKNFDFVYVIDIVQKTETDLLKTRSFGRKSINELKNILSKMDLELGMTFSPDIKYILGL